MTERKSRVDETVLRSKVSPLPFLGIVASSVVFVLAAGRYPGGYAWIDQSISSLFQPSTLDGANNPARPLAVVAVFLFCTSVAFMFHHISRRLGSRVHQSTVQIGGIGSMVYAFLTVTPMHDLLVGIALLFFVTAMLALFHALYLEKSWVMLGSGMACISLTLGNAIIYYGNLLYGFLPIVQKLSTVFWVGWLCVMYREKR